MAEATAEAGEDGRRHFHRTDAAAVGGVGMVEVVAEGATMAAGGENVGGGESAPGRGRGHGPGHGLTIARRQRRTERRS